MGILSKSEIRDRLFDPDINKRLIITPLLSEDQIGFGTIDLRIGTDFLIPKRNQAYIFDPMDTEKMDELTLKADKEFVDIGDKFYLHPNKIILAGTLEYIKMPVDLTARLRVRSSYERLGLHVSSLANPGYTGALTLTLTNIGNTPIVMYPGSRAVQITLYRIKSSDLEGNQYNGKYKNEVGPLFSKAHHDDDLEIIRKIKDRS